MPHPNTVEVTGPGVYPLDPVRECPCPATYFVPCSPKSDYGERCQNCGLGFYEHINGRCPGPDPDCPTCHGTGCVPDEDGPKVEIVGPVPANFGLGGFRVLRPASWPKDSGWPLKGRHFPTAALAYADAVRAYEEDKR